MIGAMTFAFGAGLLATVSPCAFVMLPSFLAMSLGTAEERDEAGLLSRCAQGLAMGLAVSAAFSVVLVFAGGSPAPPWPSSQSHWSSSRSSPASEPK
jgi:cytochrome c biogenesis protein CcdA